MQCTSLSLIVAPTFFINIDESVSINAGQSGIYIIENRDNVYSINELNMRSIKRVVVVATVMILFYFFQVASTAILFVDRDLYAVGSSMTLLTSFVSKGWVG